MNGCRKYSEGCANCYMFVLDRAHKVPEQSMVVARTKNFSAPLERDRKGRFKVPAGFWVRVNMSSDTFIEEADLGGEAYGGLRPCRYEWVKAVSDACARHRVNFAFDSTGEVFVKDGHTYRIPEQRTQIQQAFKSGLSHYYGPIEFKLFDPDYGTPLTPEDLYRPQYNALRCNECTMAFACAGCSRCGKCKEVELVGLEAIWKPEDQA